MIGRIIFTLVGIAALWCISLFFRSIYAVIRDGRKKCPIFLPKNHFRAFFGCCARFVRQVAKLWTAYRSTVTVRLGKGSALFHFPPAL